MIQYVEASHMEELVIHIDHNINITLRSYTIEATFGLAEAYFLRFIYDNNDYESGVFNLTLSLQSPYANNTPSVTTSPVQPTTLTNSAILPTTTMSTSTGASSLTHVANSSSSEATTTLTVTVIPNTPKPDRNNGGGLSRDAKVGIGIGCSVAGVIGAVGIFIFYRRTKSNPVPEEPPNLRNAGPIEIELEGSSPAQKIFEVDGKHEAANLPELPSHPISSRELPG